MTERTPQVLERFQSWPPRGLALLLALGISASFVGCSRKAEVPEDAPQDVASPAEDPAPSAAAPATLPEEAPPEELAEAEPPEPPPPHPGPWLWITRTSAGIYSEPRAKRELKLGYVQRGGKLPILAEKVEGSDCSKGWYRVAGGGYICSLVGTTDENDKEVKFGPRQPNLEEILPYTYARNAHNGTPLYRSLPSKAQMLEYEPYLKGGGKKEKDAKTEPKKPDSAAASTELAKTSSSGGGASKPASAQNASAINAPVDVSSAASSVARTEEEAAKEPPKPWWQQEDVKDRLHEIKLDQLAEEADGVLDQRMMRGFYVAVDNTFKWGGRNWYKTTRGLLAPSDRFWLAKGSEFKGVELDGDTWQLPVAWVYGGRKQSTTYLYDEEKKRLTPKGSVRKFEALQLTGKRIEVSKRTYHETASGTWIRDDQVRLTVPGERPEEVGDNERWIDVNVTEQTLVAFQGDRPVYATLVSTGKESNIKAKDHRTPRGAWRVREKHLTAKMDGDGTAAGDLPYRIEDVPYVMYYYKSYALHGAFWHENYGVRMSHGCVNLAPLDAKHVFFWADPQIPEGWHGMWSNDDQQGSLIVAHE